MFQHVYDGVGSRQLPIPTRPKTGQQTRDDRAVRLDLDAVARVAQQVPAAENLLEKPEENYDGPAVAVEQRDDFGGHVEEVRALRSRPPFRLGIAGACRFPLAGRLALVRTPHRRRHSYRRSGGRLRGKPRPPGHTAIGDTTNTAARIESATRELGADILMSAATYGRLTAVQRLELGATGMPSTIAVKNKAELLTV